MVRFPTGAAILVFSTASRSALNLRNFVSNGHRESFAGIKGPDPEADLSPPSSSEVKDALRTSSVWNTFVAS